MIRRPPRSTPIKSSAASDVYKRQVFFLQMEDELKQLSEHFNLLSVESSSSVIHCSLCNLSLGSSLNKGIKQHLKSKTHKQLLKGKPLKNEKIQKQIVQSVCDLCDLLDNFDSHYHPFADLPDTPDSNTITEGKRICIAPPFIAKPTLGTKPFITLANGELPHYPKKLEDVLNRYCVGFVERMPNIDINGSCQEVHSLNAAGHLLLQAHQNKETYWAAFSVNDMIQPKWWPNDRVVPGYTQIIVGRGATDIGIHTDVYGPQKIQVDTYITLCSGAKQVLMLPPNAGILSELPEKFPLDISLELAKKIHDEGGYFFELKRRSDKGHVTLFVPKGWHHWLLGRSNWAVIFGASRM
eukprot:TRINITY_DN3897_c0_g1_i1.p1 TRINITY_DN3897_c0_g1~~TRINITY_DN3897_c0_g1_i1.p1  ORF type:complete len:353 (+),score=66.40 TRINITY_DN3897_c0_g1_i1:1-1059(+)